MNRIGQHSEGSFLLAVALSLLAACSQNKSSTAPSPIESTAQARQLPPTEGVDTPHAPLSQQKQCAEQAKRFFDESYAPVKDGVNYWSTSHFDAKNNTCYILVTGGGVSFGSPISSDVVFDAYEGRTYASYLWINTNKKKFWEVAPTECSVKPRNAEEIVCHSQEEFASLIDKHFGIAR